MIPALRGWLAIGALLAGFTEFPETSQPAVGGFLGTSPSFHQGYEKGGAAANPQYKDPIAALAVRANRSQ